MSQSHLQLVDEYVQIYLDERVNVAYVGKKVDGLEHGNFYKPTVLYDVDNRMRIAQKEIFSPVPLIIPFKRKKKRL